MRALVVILCLALPGVAPAEEVIRIAVAEKLPRVEVSGPGLRARALHDDGSYAEVAGGKAALARQGTELLLNGAPVGAVAVKLRAEGPLRIAGKQLRGTIEVSLDSKGLLAVNELSMEDYLAAVLGSEMPPSFPAEALRAQAVAARTYAVHKKIAAGDRPYHLGATVLSQVYGGVHREDPRTRAAVDATSGQLLVHEHEPIEAYFFSSCGGRTEGGGDALGRALPYLTAHACGEPASTPGARWTLELTARELGARLGLPAVERLEITERSRTGRARRVSVVAGKQRSMAAVELRRRLGYGELKSLQFEVTRQGRGFRFTGKGSGHAAGLCQWGARAAAERGKTAEQILELYYPGATLRRMY